MYHLSVVLGSRDKAFIQHVSKLFDSGKVNMTLTSIADCADALEASINIYHPDLIICDWDLAPEEISPADYWEGLKNRLDNCEFLFVSTRREFDVVYEAVRLHAAGFILLPAKESELRKALCEASDYIYRIKHFLQDESNAASRYLFMKRGINTLNATNSTIDQVNRSYGTRLSPGLFRAFIIKMDCDSDVMSVFENDVLRDKIIQITSDHLAGLYFDLVTDKLSDGVFFVINYPQKFQEEITDKYDLIFADIKQAFSSFSGITLTMCISREYDNVSRLTEAKNEVFDARWARKSIGTDKIITADVLLDSDMSLSDRRKLSKLRDQTIHAFQTVNLEESRKCMKALFSYLKRPGVSADEHEMRLLVRELIDSLFNMHYDILSAYDNVEASKHVFIYRVNMARTYDEVERVFIKLAEDVLSQVADLKSKCYSKPVLTVINYVQHHISQNLSLNEAADLVGFTAPYFSNVFKKETGQTFSDFTVECKLDTAKKMLKDSDDNIGEIACQIGYNDTRYFSKVFKKHENISPTEYRRIMQANGNKNDQV